MSDSSKRATQLGELKDLRAHFRYLASRSQQYLGTVPSWLRDEASVDLDTLDLLRSSIQSLVGIDQSKAQESCLAYREHPNRGICETCGFSINLYLGAFEKILRRKDQGNQIGRRRRKGRGVTIGPSRT